MTEPTAAVEPSHPPEVFLRLANPVMRLLLRSPVGGPIRKQLMLLHFTGRKTGHRYDVPVTAHRINDELYSLTDARWRHNFRGGTDVNVTLDGRTTAMHGELVEDPDTIAALYVRRIEDFGVKRAQRLLGIKVHTLTTPTVGAVAEAARRYHFSAIRLSAKT